LAQDNYVPIQSKGSIPKELGYFSAENVEKARADINQQSDRVKRKAEFQFHLYNTYSIDQLMKSGYILFGDELSNYVQRVGDYVIQQSPDFNKEMKFYVVKSPQVNAFSVYNNIIFVNVGLLAKIESEAQLAYILSHELIHYRERHSIEGYTEEYRLQKGIEKYADGKATDKIDTYIKYSQEHETYADKHGLLDFYQHTDYAMQDVIHVFNTLKYSTYPYADRYYDPKYLIDDTLYKVPEWLYELSTDKLEVEDDKDDSRHMHPNVDKRRRAIGLLIRTLKHKGDKQFVVSKEDFLRVQKLARHEVAYQYVMEGRYDDALYQAYLLQHDYSKSQFVDEITSYALYGLCKHKSVHRLNAVLKSAFDINGKSQKLLQYFNRIDLDTYYQISIKNIYLHAQKYDDHFYKELYQDLLIDYLNGNSIAQDSLSPFDGLWYDLAQDSVFMQFYRSHYKETKKREEEAVDLEIDIDVEFEITNNENQDTTSELVIYNSNYQMPKFDSIIIFNPRYYRNIYEKPKFVKTQQKKGELIEILQENASLCGMHVEVMDMNLLNSDLNRYNEAVAIQEYVNEFFRIKYVFGIDEIQMIPYSKRSIQSIRTKYNTPHVALTGFSSYTYFRDGIINHPAAILFGSGTIVGLPVVLYYIFAPEHHTYYMFLTLNMDSGEISYFELDHIQSMGTKPIMNSNVYSTLLKISN
jgi:hypothetical protein